MAYEISHFFCSCFVVNPSILSWERMSQGRLELFGIWNLIIRVSMVNQRIVLLDPLELCAPCMTVLWVLLVESPMVPIPSCRGLGSCWSSSKRMQRSSSTSEVHLQKWPRHNVRQIPSFVLRGTRNNMSSTETPCKKIDKADANERSAKLNEGKDLFLECNKHILLAEKYGWDTMACYTDSDEEKQICKVVKESKQLRDEKKGWPSPNRRRKGVFPSNLPNGECSLTVQPPLLRWQENFLLPTRCAPHVFAVFNRDILPRITDQQLPLAGLMQGVKFLFFPILTKYTETF